MSIGECLWSKCTVGFPLVSLCALNARLCKRCTPFLTSLLGSTFSQSRARFTLSRAKKTTRLHADYAVCARHSHFRSAADAHGPLKSASRQLLAHALPLAHSPSRGRSELCRMSEKTRSTDVMQASSVIACCTSKMQLDFDE